VEWLLVSDLIDLPVRFVLLKHPQVKIVLHCFGCSVYHSDTVYIRSIRPLIYNFFTDQVIKPRSYELIPQMPAVKKPTIILLGTCDSKLDEILYLREKILEDGSCDVLLVDVGKSDFTHPLVDVSHSKLLSNHNVSAENATGRDIAGLDRGEYVTHMIGCAASFLRKKCDSSSIHAAISVGGSSGTSLTAAVMRNAFPIGFPKLIVSTMASGDVKHYVEDTDITMMYSVVDIAGTNSILNAILTNAAGAVIGMAKTHATLTADLMNSTPKCKRVGISMFGVTTPCVDAIRSYLEKECGFEVFVFHATGSGGRALERLVREKCLDGIIDLTTTEIVDELFGGVLSAGPDRLKAAGKISLPQIVSVGACDMVNFGPRDTVPEKFKGRNLVEHNPAVTLMRTTKEDSRRVGLTIAGKLKANVINPSSVLVYLPMGGISMLSTPGGPFYDPEADEALFSAIEEGLDKTEIRVVRDKREINDPSFAEQIAKAFADLVAGV
jgi:uncharacterized protein (UPF0261 family)